MGEAEADLAAVVVVEVAAEAGEVVGEEVEEGEGAAAEEAEAPRSPERSSPEPSTRLRNTGGRTYQLGSRVSEVRLPFTS